MNICYGKEHMRGMMKLVVGVVEQTAWRSINVMSRRWWSDKKPTAWRMMMSRRWWSIKKSTAWRKESVKEYTACSMMMFRRWWSKEEVRRQKVPLHGHIDLAGKVAGLAGLVGVCFRNV